MANGTAIKDGLMPRKERWGMVTDHGKGERKSVQEGKET